MPNVIDVHRLPTSLQNQFTGFSYNQAGDAPPNVVTETRVLSFHDPIQYVTYLRFSEHLLQT